ncbi:MAG: type II toxin-antitoxin system RelE/ParE family toxin [Bacteroidetes bacterium SB0662_bin_6]|nr:type II toxin-antitoxin system RelE/ParE family toxin [Bacteroidetes bacterium SB0668_bin_1]MYE03491.1 type II toxin-antitoxin system RelE/ParE family toxin [Bacteroidetes bacterium SB0662_bin_6]
MRIFRNKSFSRFARQKRIDDAALCEAVRRAEAGLIDADLGGNVIKQRIPRQNQGASKGFRSIVLFKKGEKAFFVYGFAKSGQDNIRQDELKAFRELAKELFALEDSELLKIMANKTITEVICDE